MSKARLMGDAERTATMLDLVRRSYEGDGTQPERLMPYVVLEEVAPGTGWAARRWADVLALSVWPSNGFTLDGYEIKASRADLKRELADLSKHQAVARYCDTWTLVLWDKSMLVEGLPDDWGITLTEEKNGERVLITEKKAAKREPELWSRGFVCSLVRNAVEQGAGAAYVARALLAADERSRRQYKDALDRDLHSVLQPIARALFGDNYYRTSWTPEEVVAKAVAAAQASHQSSHPARTQSLG